MGSTHRFPHNGHCDPVSALIPRSNSTKRFLEFMYEKRRFLDIANPFACKVEHTYGSLRNHSINQTLFFYNVTTLAAHLSLIESCADPDTQYNRNPTKELRNAVRMRPSARGHPHDVICTMQSAQGKSVTAPTATTTAMTATTAVTARYNGRNKYGSYDSPDGSSGHNGYNRQDSYVQQAQQRRRP